MRFTIGGFYGHFKPLATLILLREEHPAWFRDEVIFDSTFDTWPNMLWNGGRHRFGVPYPFRRMERDLRFFNSRGIGLRLTCTNLLLQPEHLADPTCNRVLALAHDPMNAVIVASPLLEAWVRERYPRLRIVGSCTTDVLDGATLAARAREVDLLVLPPDLNRRRKLISRIGPERLEVLVNERCRAACPDRKEHYRMISRNVLEFEVDAQRDVASSLPANCVFRVGTEAWKRRQEAAVEFPLHLSWEETVGLRDLGVQYFKLGGRDVALHVLLRDLAYWMVHEEHQQTFTFAFLEALHEGRFARLPEA